MYITIEILLSQCHIPLEYYVNIPNLSQGVEHLQESILCAKSLSLYLHLSYHNSSSYKYVLLMKRFS